MATREDLSRIKLLLSNTDVIESCTREKANTKWNFYKVTNVTFSAALLKEVPMGCKIGILPDPLLRNLFVKSFTFQDFTRKSYNDNLSLRRALAFHLQGIEKIEEESSSLFNIYREKIGGMILQTVWKILQQWVTLLMRIFYALYDVDIVHVSLIGELASRIVGKRSDTVRLLRYNSHFCYVPNVNVLFIAFLRSVCDQFIKGAQHLERPSKTCKE